MEHFSKKTLCCHACGEVIFLEYTSIGKNIRCFQCHTLLKRTKRGALLLSFLFAITSLILFYPALTMPLLKISLHSFDNQVNIINTIETLFTEQYPFVGLTVAMTILIIPFTYLSLIASIFIIKRKSYLSRVILKIISIIQTWHMVDVFLMGVLVSIIKLLGDFHLNIGIGFYFITLLTITITITNHFFDIKQAWNYISYE